MRNRVIGPKSIPARVAAAAMLALPALAASGPVIAQDNAVLRFGLSAYPPGLDPFRHEGAAGHDVKLQIFRGLLGLNGSGEIVGELAESWEENGTEYVFHLRQNATFHNGEAVTGEDVKWSLEQIRAEGSTAYFKDELQVITEVEVIDDSTVRIKLDAPTPAFLKLLATPYVPILSREAGLEDPVGAGPYRITATEEGVAIEFEAFDDYYKEGYPKTERMRMIAYRDENLRVAALEAGDVDIIEYVPWQSMAKIEDDPDLTLQETTGPNMVLNFNVEQPPFDDARVRRAVCNAINRKDIVDAAFYGRGAPLEGLPLDENSEVADDKTQTLFGFDMEGASAALKDSGATGQEVTLLSSSTYSMHQDTALVIQQYLINAGLQVTLDLPEWGARVAQGNEGQYQFAVNGSGTVVNDPDGLTAMIGSGTPSYKRSYGYSNEELDALLKKGRHELDPEARAAVYDEIAQIVAEDVPLCPLTRRTQGFGLRQGVEGFHALVGSASGYSAFGLEAVTLD
ncbi:ABC transporter substrate-binding protein [Tropicimonas sp. IMCC34011]|uniref:ABC transporter substrate-binding protein n=1 Tax=Tropicimonas sp. IMCC34011 TaxID=2248759 RepID=UPI000E237084|nr:ABC transporter substrate-binding protein [Tropicimonas sp. IMCC34011]